MKLSNWRASFGLAIFSKRGLLHLLLFFAIGLLASMGAVAEAQVLNVEEHQITVSPAEETTPTLGNDGVSNLVVFTMRVILPDGSPAPGDIWYQRLTANGAPTGPAVQVTADATDDQLNDVSGDYIVYTAFDAVDLESGNIMFYRISTSESALLARTDVALEPRIYGNNVVWAQGAPGATQIMWYEVGWLGTDQEPRVVAGPMPPASEVAVGSNYIVWTQYASGEADVWAFDLLNPGRIQITRTDDIDETQPATSGPWITWQKQIQGSNTREIEALNPGTYDSRSVTNNGAYNLHPSIDGDLIAWESSVTGNWDVFLYRLSDGQTFQVTTDPAAQFLNDVFGNKVAYVDIRNGSKDIYLASLNQSPLANAGADQTVHAGSPVTLDGAGSTDPDLNYPLTYAWEITSKPVGSNASLNNPNTVSPSFTPDVPGTYEIQLIVADSLGLPSAPDTIVVSTTNTAPILNHIGDKTIREGEPFEFVVTATDPDGDTLTYSASNLPSGASFDPLTQTFTWTPNYDQAGNYVSVLFTVTDNGMPPASASETITITVGTVNRPPILNPIGNRSVNEQQLLTITISAMDPDGDALTYSASNLPLGATFDPATQTFTWTPNYDQAGNYVSVLFTVTDNGIPPASASEAITITVGNVNRPPILAPIGDRMGTEGALLEFTITATDPDGDALTYSAEDLPPGATFDPVTQKFSWTPGYDQSGSFTMEFSVTDSGSPIEVDSEVVTITVGNVNKAPVFAPVGTQQVLENQLLQFYVMATDYDGDAITYSTGPLPSGASFDPMSQLFSWRPDSTQAGTYTVAFYATDTGSPPMEGQLDVVINVGDMPTPCQLADQIIQTVLSLNLRKSVENSYMANLKKVCKFVEDGKIIRAVVQLDAFIVKVIIDIAQGDISEAAGRNLINMAINLIKVLMSSGR